MNRPKAPMTFLQMACAAIAIACLPGCHAKVSRVSHEHKEVQWPDHIAGVPLQTTWEDIAITARVPLPTAWEDLAIYAATADEASAIAGWIFDVILQTPLPFAFKQTRGAVIVPGPESTLPEALRKWRACNVKRDRFIAWGEDPLFGDRRRNCLSIKGRPYCWVGETPYFLESFHVTGAQAEALGLLRPLQAHISWICFLTSDSEFFRSYARAADEETQKAWDSALEDPAWMGLLAIPSQAVSVVILGAGAAVSGARSRQIDLELMYLQRREALLSAIIGSSAASPDDRARLLLLLQDATDRKWQELYFRRPMD